jgi:uncharacterized damage-inducible protein DinB
MTALHATLDLNTRLFLNTLEGVDDAVATTRPNGDTNHLAFLACHLLDARHYMASFTGLETDKPFKEILDEAATIDDIAEFPKLGEIKAAWEEVSVVLADHLSELSEEELGKDSSQAFPIEDGTVFGAVTFLLQHESYHIGQLSLLRRFFGLPPMKYT